MSTKCTSDDTLALVRGVQQTHPQVNLHTDYTWKKDFSDARNHANAKCRGAWIISVDCDTVVEVSCDLRAYLAALPAEVGIVEVQNDWGASRFSFPKIYRNVADIYYKYQAPRGPERPSSMPAVSPEKCSLSLKMASQARRECSSRLWAPRPEASRSMRRAWRQSAKPVRTPSRMA